MHVLADRRAVCARDDGRDWLAPAVAARVVVEQAIGVLTERQGSSPRQAFERLRKVARARGRKVHDLAREVVASATDKGVPLPPELAGGH